MSKLSPRSLSLNTLLKFVKLSFGFSNSKLLLPFNIQQRRQKLLRNNKEKTLLMWNVFFFFWGNSEFQDNSLNDSCGFQYNQTSIIRRNHVLNGISIDRRRVWSLAVDFFNSLLRLKRLDNNAWIILHVYLKWHRIYDAFKCSSSLNGN